MDSSRKTGECHFTWNLKEIPKVSKIADKILRKIQNNLAETDFLKIEHLLFKACLQLWFKDATDALASLDEAKREIENRRSEDVYKGYKSVELLNRMWIEDTFLSDAQTFGELNDELNKLEKLEEKDLRVIGAIKAAALMRLGPFWFDTNLELFKAAHQACPSNPDFLFGLALITGQNMRAKRPLSIRYDRLDQFLKNLMDEEKGYWEKLIDMKPNHKGYHYAKSMLGLNLCRRDESDDTQKALELLNEAYDEAPDIHEVARNLIRVLKKTDLDRSISILKTAISQQQDRKESHHQLALCYIETAKQEKGKRHQDEADEWTIEALEELDKCLQLDGSHVYALLQKATQLKHLEHLKRYESPECCYLNMIHMLDEFVPIQRLKLYNDFAFYLDTNTSASRYRSRFNYWQEVMDISTDESFEYQREISGKWKTTTKVNGFKKKAYIALKKHYRSEAWNSMKLGILFYQNFEFDRAIDELATVDQRNAKVPYYLAKTYIKKRSRESCWRSSKT